MKVSVGERWEDFVGAMVDQGRYGSASEVIREGLRLVEEREAKLHAMGPLVSAPPARTATPSVGAAAPAAKASETLKVRR